MHIAARVRIGNRKKAIPLEDLQKQRNTYKNKAPKVRTIGTTCADSVVS